MRMALYRETRQPSLSWKGISAGLAALCLIACPGISQTQTAPPFTLLHSFNGNDGIMFEPNIPWSGYSVLGSGLIQGKDGNLYGATPYASTSGGTVFKITPGGVFTTLYSFGSQPGDGYEPNGVIQGKDGALYGTTVEGGTNPHNWVISGTIFKLTLSGTLTTLYDFALGTAGYWPYAGLVQAKDGNLYGTTAFGGGGSVYSSDGYGSVFKIRPDGSGFKFLYGFSGGTDGVNPWSPLIQGKDGDLYGADYGPVFTPTAPYNAGAIFKITTSGTLTVLHDFGASDGTWPFGALVQGTDGSFYGTTESGGANNNGTIFKITPSGTLTHFYTFSAINGAYTNADGANPSAGLIQGKDGALYGTTANGGATGYGTVFRITTSGALTTLYSFSDDSGGGNADGADPISPLLLGKDGNLYGTAGYGGPDDDGVVFKLTMTPIIARFSPAKDPTGTAVTLTGVNFTEATGVQVGNIAASFKVNSDASLTLKIPTGAKSARIKVTNPFGQGASATNFIVTH